MADILIRGVQFPTMAQAYKTLIVSYDGKVYEGVCPQPTAKNKESIAHAVELPEHGDLIDRVAFRAEMDKHYPFDYGTQHRHGEADAAKSTVINMLANAPVVVQASKEALE